MEKEQFKEFSKKSFEIVKNNTKHPMQLFRDEMVHYNIVMYSLFDNIYRNDQTNIMSTLAELNYIFNRILLSSTARQDFDKFLKDYANHYEEVIKAFNEEPTLQGLNPQAKSYSIITECMRTIATSCEAENDRHLRTVDMFILCMIIAENLNIDFEKLVELTQYAADEIVKLIEAQQKTEEVKESGEAKEEPADNNN